MASTADLNAGYDAANAKMHELLIHIGGQFHFFGVDVGDLARKELDKPASTPYVLDVVKAVVDAVDAERAKGVAPPK